MLASWADFKIPPINLKTVWRLGVQRGYVSLTEEDKAWLLEKCPDASDDEIWIFSDKVSYLIGMSDYLTEKAREQAFCELTTKRGNKNE